ncbi:MAG: HAMP domain-containing protein [Ignavibacteriae bacterium]|nr:HAMP domain-containing protein [Ignavibacteriota bacterium]
MKIKAKLTLGIGLLFAAIITLTGIGIKYTDALATDSDKILKDNYNTLEYVRIMLKALDEPNDNPRKLAIIEENLRKQEHNITEIGEKEITARLTEHFNTMKINPDTDGRMAADFRKDLFIVMNLNMEAIVRKNNIARQTSRTATIWMAAVGALCFLIGFTILVNLPRSIANPIQELTQSIKQIAARNYSQRVSFGGESEFGEIASSFNTMAEKLEEYNNSSLAKLLIEKKRIETLINNMQDPIIGLNANHNILFANDEALKIIGLKAENTIGRLAEDVAVGNDLLRSLLDETLLPTDDNSPTNKQKPIKIYANNKESYFEKEVVNIAVTPTGELHEQHIGHFIILKNITPFKELDSAKTNFIATVSHELKTPIASIKLSLQLLETKSVGIVNPEQQQLIESIKDDAERLLKITGELLNLSQVETGNIQLNIHQCSPYEILHYALGAVMTQAEQKHISLQVVAEEKLPIIKADAEKSAWVLINFLTNAIRYSPEHSTVTIELKQKGQAVVFAVQDVGKGIDVRYRDKIFDRYFQVPGSSKSGTGLGLSISKEFIEVQGGTIGVESEIGMGSRFYFTLSA